VHEQPSLEAAGRNEAPALRVMSGNEAIARGAWEAGVKVAAAYPGTPSTEILENIATYPAEDVEAQWATNEKVSVDVAIGASFAGARALAAMKHVGLNVAADAFMSQTYIGAHGGLVLVVCDDPGIHSSQNAQDTRLLCRLANAPVLEPADAQEALDFTRLAFDLSERFDTPVVVRGTTLLSHTRSQVRVGARKARETLGFSEDREKNVMTPTNARKRHPLLLEREAKLRAYFEEADITRWEQGSADFGVITVGTAYSYVREVAPTASILKLAGSYPLPEETIGRFCRSVGRVLVVEELEPVVETEIRAMGIAVAGKDCISRIGELSPDVVRDGLARAGFIAPAAKPEPLPGTEVVRPPVLCAGCSHVSTYMALRALDVRVAGDIGCYTLAATPPLLAIDTVVSMGSSIANAVGMAKAGTERPVVATIGDSTFLHAGIPALIDAVYNQADITVLLLDNHVTAMTGGQDHPGTGRTLRGADTHRVDYAELARACGVEWVETVDSYDLGALHRTVREAVQFKGVALVISDRPCVLDPVKIKGPAFTVLAADCTACQACLNIGCPSITWGDERYDGHYKAQIDDGCIGCTLCAQICPTGAIQLAQS